MRRLTPEAKLVLIGLAAVLIFALGLYLGASAQEGIHKTLAAVGR